VNMFGITPRQLAVQLTVLQHKAFEEISLEELQDHSENAERPALKRFIEQSNQNTWWVVTEMLAHRPLKVAFEYFIDVCEELMKLKNYQGAADVALAVSHPAVARLHGIWAQVSPKYLEKKKKLANVLIGLEDNYKDYKALLEGEEGPVIPFLMVILQDLGDPNVTHRTTVAVHTASGDQMRLGANPNSKKISSKEAVLNLLTGPAKKPYNFSDEETGLKEGGASLATMLEKPALDREAVYKKSEEIEPRRKRTTAVEDDGEDDNNWWLLAGGLALIIASGAALGYVKWGRPAVTVDSK